MLIFSLCVITIRFLHATLPRPSNNIFCPAAYHCILDDTIDYTALPWRTNWLGY